MVAYLCILVEDCGVLSLNGGPQTLILGLKVRHLRIQLGDLGLSRIDERLREDAPAIRLDKLVEQFVDLVFA